ncbi:hypothetical protein [Vreelandella sp. EE7]
MSYQTHVALRLSDVPGAVPALDQLDAGTLAFNTADRVIYARFGDQIEPINMTSAHRDQLAALGTMATRNVFISDQPPDDAQGEDGDVWLQHWST